MPTQIATMLCGHCDQRIPECSEDIGRCPQCGYPVRSGTASLAGQIPLAATGVLVTLQRLVVDGLTPAERARGIHFAEALADLAAQAKTTFEQG